MEDSAPVVTVDRQLPFTSLAGKQLEVTVEKVHQDESDGGIAAKLRLDYDAWTFALEEGAFHLDSVLDLPDLQPDRPVELQVQLRPTLATGVEHVPEVTERLEDSQDLLRDTQSWFTTSIVQELEMPDSFDDVPDMGSTDTVSIGGETGWDDFFDGAHLSSVRDAVIEHFEGKGWEYDILEENLIHIEITIGGRALPVYIYTYEDDRECMIYSVHPTQVPEEDRDGISRLLARRNYELEHGSFGLNEMDGEVRFRVRALPDQEPFGEALDANVAAMASVFDDIWECGETTEMDAVEAGEHDVADGNVE